MVYTRIRRRYHTAQSTNTRLPSIPTACRPSINYDIKYHSPPAGRDTLKRLIPGCIISLNSGTVQYEFRRGERGGNRPVLLLCSLVRQSSHDVFDLALIRIDQLQEDFAERVPHALKVSLIKVNTLELALCRVRRDDKTNTSSTVLRGVHSDWRHTRLRQLCHRVGRGLQ